MSYGDRDVINTTVARFIPDSLPAGAEALAAVPFGARITAINGNPVETSAQVQSGIAFNLDPELTIEFDRAETVEIDASDYGAMERAAILFAFRPLLAPRVGMVQPSSPASEAGLEPLDLVVRVNGDTVAEWSDLVAHIEAAPSVALSFDVERGDSMIALTVVPATHDTVDAVTGEATSKGRLGVFNHVDVRHQRYGLFGAISRANRNLRADMSMIVGGLVGLFAGRVSPKELGGPILIGQVAGQFARRGLEDFLRFMAMFSVNLAILNMLPIPVLDGGQFVVLLAEGVRGKPLPLQLRMRMTQVGLFLLLGLMVYVMTADVLRTLGLL
jgi:regulator of sigma E protease